MHDERRYVVDTIGAFLDGSSGKWDWDDFTSTSLRSARLDSIRQRAGALDLPLDLDSEAILRKLRSEAEQLTDAEITDPRPWRMMTGVMGGLIIGALLWWSRYVPGGGLFQNLQLFLMPAVLGIAIVSLRNKLKKVGSYDPDAAALNKRGRI